MTRFDPFQRKFPSKPKPTKPKFKINHKTHFIPTNNIYNRIFPIQLRQKEIYGSSIQVIQTISYQSSKHEFQTWIFFFFSSSFFLLLFLFFFSLFLLLPIESPSQMREKNLHFLLRPCLVLSKFESNLIIQKKNLSQISPLHLGPFFFIIYAILTYHISTLTYNIFILCHLGP